MVGVRRVAAFVLAACELFVLILSVCFSSDFEPAFCAEKSTSQNSETAEKPEESTVSACKEAEQPKKTAVVPKSMLIENVELIGQETLVSGCETCSAAMLLGFYGYDISETEFADEYLICKPFTATDGGYYAADPDSAFIGSPYTSSSFGIYSHAMAKSINGYLENKEHKAEAVTGKSIEKLCTEYIAQGQPVMLWATINMAQSYEGTSWIVNYADENASSKKGESFTWIANEHCLLLTGYDGEYYYFNDPWTNSRCKYSKALTERRYKELGMQAVVLKATACN